MKHFTPFPAILLVLASCGRSQEIPSPQPQEQSASHAAPAATEAKAVAGTYAFTGDDREASLIVTFLPDSTAHITGEAYSGTHGAESIHFGTLDFIASIDNGTIRHTHSSDNGIYRLTITFTQTGLEAKDEGRHPDFGAGVSFTGEYRRK